MAFKSHFLGVAFAALTGFLATNTQAQALPDAAVTQTGTGTTASYAGGVGNIAFDGFGPTPIPPLYDATSAAGSASVAYWIEVVGPANIQAPVDFFASGFVGYPVGGLGLESVTATLGSNPMLYAYSSSRAIPNPLGAPQASFNGSTVYNVMTNTPVPVLLTASYVAGGLGSGYYGGGETAGSVTAWATIASAWEQVGYTLVSSGAPASVPEPATYGLLLGGLLLAFFASRRAGKDRMTRA
jgi:hypothetical protein